MPKRTRDTPPLNLPIIGLQTESLMMAVPRHKVKGSPPNAWRSLPCIDEQNGGLESAGPVRLPG